MCHIYLCMLSDVCQPRMTIVSQSWIPRGASHEICTDELVCQKGVKLESSLNYNFLTHVANCLAKTCRPLIWNLSTLSCQLGGVKSIKMESLKQTPQPKSDVKSKVRSWQVVDERCAVVIRYHVWVSWISNYFQYKTTFGCFGRLNGNKKIVSFCFISSFLMKEK